MDNDDSYRNLLQELEIKAQEQYDKTVLMLSTGALGISFAFIKDIVKLETAIATNYLMIAWVCFILSITCTLISFYSSRIALSKAISDLDLKIENNGNKADWTTHILNVLSGFSFVIGLILIIIFIYKNIGV